MSSYGFLIFTFAFAPTVTATCVWWYVTHFGEDLNKCCAAGLAPFKD